MSEPLPVKRLTLFKHGIAFIEREGPCSEGFELTFRREEMSDVLKSLAVWVESGEGRIGAVGFEPPADPEGELSERGLLLTPGAGLHELLHALRGRAVEVRSGGERWQGEVVGWQQAEQAGEVAGGARVPDRLLLRDESDSVVTVTLDDLSQIRVRDPRSQEDLELLVDKSRASTARERKRVTVALADGSPEATVRCAYVVPAPVWRVSYRLVVDVGDDGGDRLTVLAWAIVHNPVDEALSDVELVITTGQPVSFQIDLYQPRHVARATVEESNRATAAPRAFERARPAPMAAAARGSAPDAAMAAPAAAMAPMAADFGENADSEMRSKALAADLADASETNERSELFEYRLRDRLELARGGSAMVPLSAGSVAARRERIWRRGQGPAPDVVLSFTNETGLVLEEGAAVVYADGGYAGEAMVPYSARGAEVRVGYAKDLALRCRQESQQEQRMVALHTGRGAYIESHEHHITHTLVAESDHADDVDVIFEIPRVPEHVVAAGNGKPGEETANYHRFAVTAPGRGEASLEVTESWTRAQRFHGSGVDASRVEWWLQHKFLSRALRGSLRQVLAAWAERDEHLAEKERAEDEISKLSTRTESLSRQLEVLREGGEEGALRLRTAQQLAKLQDRVAELDTTARQHDDDATDADQRARDLLSASSR